MKRRTKVKYSLTLAERLCSLIEEGKSVSDIVRSNRDKFPDRSTIYKWRRNKPAFKEMFDTAYETKMYRHIDELYDMMNAPLPTMKSIEEEIGQKLDPMMAKSYLNAALAKRRMKIDTLKFIAGKLVPKLVKDMSDKIDVKHHNAGLNVILPDWALSIEEQKKLQQGTVIDGEIDDK